MSGEGADELFGGYAWAYRRRKRLAALRPWLDRIPARLREVIALYVYAQAGMPVTAHRFRELLPPTVELIDRFARRDLEAECTQAYGFVENRNDRAVLGGMLADLGDFLTPLLRRLDRTSMGASVECRVPFLDPRLAAKAANLPLDYKIGKRADKWVLKEVARRYMPAKLVDRPKMGFPLPLDDYIAPLADPAFFAGGFLETVLGFSGPGIERQLGQWRRFVHGTFGLVTLEMWGRLYLMGETIEALDARIAGLEAGAGLASAA
jgi:asparagine synthetase B (glutamine-hydrolysing)